jgi:IclR family pca regulon transcriptional regulator
MSVKSVKSLIKGLETLEAFSSNPLGLKLREVTRLTGLPKATAYRLLQTLLHQDYLHYFPNSGMFRLGPKVMSLGFTTLSGFEMAELAKPYLEELSKQVGQNVNLGILDEVEVVYLVRIKVRSILDINLAVGSRLSAYNSAIGKALLASLGGQKLAAIIDQISRDPEVAREIGPGGNKLKRQLAVVRRQGYALCDGEVFRGLTSIAAPVYDANGSVEAAINVPVFNEVCSLKDLIEVKLPLLLKTAKTISQLRGYQVDPGSKSGKRRLP